MTRFTVAVACILISAMSISAQMTASRLDGTVRDQTGAVIPGARITLSNLVTGAIRSRVTNESGGYVFPNVPVGSYRITAEADGFKRVAVDNVKVDVGTPATVNFSLEVGEVTEVVEVTASQGQGVINTVNAELNTVVSRRQILDLPLNGRDPIDLAFLQAGVTNNGTRNTQGINGLRGTYNNLTQDGINIQDNYIRSGGLFAQSAPGVENVSEFSLTTQNIQASEGFGTSQLKLVTPSGGNEYHGSAFWFHRNTALDANSFFNNAAGLEREKLIRNQFGGRATGPILKDKLFFFAHYEGFREATSTSLLREVLTASGRRGLFSYQRLDTGEMETVNLLDLGTDFSFDPVLADLIALQPLPNSTGIGDGVNTGAFRFNSGDPTNFDRWGFRVDYDMTQNQHIEAIYSQFHFNAPNDSFNNIGEVFPGLPGAGQKSLRKLGSFAWRWSATPVLNNELRWGFQHAPIEFFTAEEFPGGYQLLFPITANPVQNFQPQGRTAPNYELIDNGSWVAGNHTFRFGGHVRWLRVDTFANFNTLPQYQLGFTGGNPTPFNNNSFPGGIATDDFDRAQSITALLGGFLDRVQQTFNVTSRTSGFVPGAEQRRHLTQNFLAFYGTDTWRVRPNFTLNLGLRWEWHMVPDERDGLGFLPVGGQQALFDPFAVLDFAGGNTGRKFFNNDLNNFAPSISFAWDPFGDGKTSIRAGYSISYVIDNNFRAVENAFDANPGLTSTVLIGGLTGTVSQGLPAVTPPEFMVPRTAADNISENPFNGLYTIDPNLRVPYVQQWSVSFERELLPDTAVEVRYVGNRGTKLGRAIDLNQMIVRENGFAADVLRAQQNMLHCVDDMGNGIPNPRPNDRRCESGFVPEELQIFPLFNFRGRTLLNNATVRNFILQGQVGAVVQQIALSRDSLFSGRAQIGPDFFWPNGNAFLADIYSNFSWSTYHALQMEVRRRFSQGLYFQANYTFSKSLTDTAGNINQVNFDAFMDLQQPTLEKRRANFDITHVFNANFIYELPVGPGRRFLSIGGWAGKILLDGWQVAGIINWQSGVPVSIISGRATINRAGRSDTNTVHTTLNIGQLQGMTGVFFLPADHPAVVAGVHPAGQPVLFDPRLIGADGRANPDFFTNPGAGEAGTLGLTPISGPSFFNTDFSLIKRTKLSETVNLEFRAEFFNIFNNTNFAPVVSQDFFGNIVENINSTAFGTLVDTFDPRIIQFAFKINF